MTDVDIHELNRRRAKAQSLVTNLGMMNAPSSDEDRLKADARYRLASDALRRAETDYAVAIGRLSTEQLLALAAES